ncbi:MAG: WHG domain-containing protein [Hydrogenophilaceae bacterium]
MTEKTVKAKPRGAYRHGDLRNALLEAALDLARDGGPDAVVLREVTRRAGVVPNAAYRHFASHHNLVQAVRSAIIARMAWSIEDELGKVDMTVPEADVAKASLRAVGAGYMKFALDEPGLFRTAFRIRDEVNWLPAPEKAGHTGLNPFQLLGLALDRYVEAGLMPAEARPGAEFLAWSTVHGMSLLTLDGPMAGLTAAQRHGLQERLLLMVERGLSMPVATKAKR